MLPGRSRMDSYDLTDVTIVFYAPNTPRKHPIRLRLARFTFDLLLVLVEVGTQTKVAGPLEYGLV